MLRPDRASRRSAAPLSAPPSPAGAARPADLAARFHPIGKTGAPASRGQCLSATAALAAVLVLPLFFASVPPLVDYPNHLARFAVLAASGADPTLDRLFAVDWAFYPNLATDLLAAVLARSLPLDVAGRLVIACAILVPVAGVVALHRTLHGAWRAWPWIAALTAYNAVLTFGFLNYVVGIGVALLGAAALIAVDGRGTGLRAAVAGTCGAAALLCHLIAFALFVLLAAAAGLASADHGGDDAARTPRRAPGRRFAAAAALALAAAGPALALYSLFGPERTFVGGGALAEAVQQVLADGLFSEPLQRLLWLASPFTAPGAVLDGPSLLLVLAVPGFALLTGGRLRVAAPALLAAVALAAGFALLPINLGDNGLVYRRLALPLALVGIAALDPIFGRRDAAATAVACVVMLVGARAALTAWTWSGQEALLRDLRTAIAPIEPGKRILATRDGAATYRVEPGEGGARVVFHRAIAYAHLPALVVPERGAYWPLVFAAPGKHPIRAHPPFDELAQHDGYLPPTRELQEAAGTTSVSPHVVDWPHRYDYVLRLNHHPGSALPHPQLSLVVETDFAALYRVRGGAPANAGQGPHHLGGRADHEGEVGELLPP